MTTKAISAVSALALAVALAVPAHAQSDSTQTTPDDSEVDGVSTLALDALPEAEIERVQEYCDALAGGGAAADAEPAVPASSDPAADADAGADADADASAAGSADAMAEADAGADAGASAPSAGEEETPSSVNQSDQVDLSTITIEACIEAGFLNDDGTPIESDDPMSDSPGGEADSDAGG